MMERRFIQPCSWSIGRYVGQLTVCLLLLLECCWGDALPPPALSLSSTDGTALGRNDGTLFLELEINGASNQQVVPVRVNNNDLQIQLSDLLANGIRPDALPTSDRTTWLRLADFPDIKYVYDNNALTLQLSVPPQWLYRQHLGTIQANSTEAAISGRGLLLNYDVYVNRLSERGTTAAIWSEQRIFMASGALTNTGTYRHHVGNNTAFPTSFDQNGYIRYDTQWMSSDEASMVTTTVGDLISGAQSWSSPVRVTGVKIARDFRLRPDLITYPLPDFSGQSAIPGTVDLFVNGYRTRSERVQPGPFTITDMPFVSGAGEATIVTTDVLGRQVSTTLPFYVSSELLQQGLSDYAASIGVMRRAYGLENFSYGPGTASGSLRYGVTNWFTAETQVDIADSETRSAFALIGAGGTLKAGQLGVFNAAGSYSSLAALKGWQYAFGYHYSNSGFSIGYQGTRSTVDFLSLANVDSFNTSPSRATNVTTISASNTIGTAGIGYIDVKSADNSRLRLLNASLSTQFRSGISVYTGFNHDLVRHQNSFAAQLMIAFGRNNVVAGAQHDKHTDAYLNYSHNAPPSGGLGWNAGYAHSGNGNSQENASLSWNNSYNHIEGGFYTDKNQNMQWANLRGAVVMMDGEVFATRQINDAFVLVSTNGVSDVPVRYENQLMGRTNKNGYLLVPSTASYYAAKYEIDTLDLPTAITIRDFEKRLTLKRNSGAVLEFSLQPITATTITVVDIHHVVLPVGSTATETNSRQAATVGYDGLVYFEGLGEKNQLMIVLPDNSVCSARFQLKPDVQKISRIGPLTCE
jgi:outer membrane usher protein